MPAARFSLVYCIMSLLLIVFLFYQVLLILLTNNYYWFSVETLILTDLHTVVRGNVKLTACLVAYVMENYKREPTVTL